MKQVHELLYQVSFIHPPIFEVKTVILLKNTLFMNFLLILLYNIIKKLSSLFIIFFLYDIIKVDNECKIIKIYH